MVVGVALGVLAGLVGLVGALTGTAAAWALLGLVVPGLYVAFVVLAAVLVARGDGLRTRLWFLVVLPSIHFGWGLGFVAGFLDLTGNITAHTGR